MNYSYGVESLPIEQSRMTSGQNNIIVSEVGYLSCQLAAERGETGKCGSTPEFPEVATSAEAGEALRRMLDDALPYHEAGWLKALLVYSRNAGGWAMQVCPGLEYPCSEGAELTPQGEALVAFASEHG
jgi:hypothetical protein